MKYVLDTRMFPNMDPNDLGGALYKIGKFYENNEVIVANLPSPTPATLSQKGPLVSLNVYWFGVQLVVPKEVMGEIFTALEIGGGAAGVSATLMGAFTYFMGGAVATGPAAPVTAAVFVAVGTWIAAEGLAAKAFDKGNGLCWTFAWPTIALGPIALATIIPIPCTPVSFNHRAIDGHDAHQDTAIAFLSHAETAFSVTMAGNTFTNTWSGERFGLLDYVDSAGAKKFLRVDGKQFLVADNAEMRDATGVWDIDYMVGDSGQKYTANIAW